MKPYKRVLERISSFICDMCLFFRSFSYKSKKAQPFEETLSPHYKDKKEQRASYVDDDSIQEDARRTQIFKQNETNLTDAQENKLKLQLNAPREGQKNKFGFRQV